MSAEDNRQRAFADVVTVDAWHKNFDGKQTKVDLHTDVSFNKARVGGEPDSAVRFRLSIKRAELVVVISETEPVAVDRSSVAREFEQTKHVQKRKFSIKREANIKGDAKASVSPISIHASSSIAASGKAIVTDESTSEIKSELLSMRISQSQTVEGFYRWIIESSDGKSLIGKPWDAIDKPRLKLIDKRQNKKGLAPVVTVEVRCRREDLIIEDVELKNQNRWEKIKTEVGLKNKMIAVEAYIRQRLSHEGLNVNDISDKFCQLTMANVLASES